ncbi:MAG: thioesterase [Bacteroidia bacterium]|nr:thioesterase [Bacteroidia bacterium]
MNQAKLQQIFKQVTNPLSFNFFMWKELPAAFWSGVRVVSADFEKVVVKVPYKRFSKNPFGSTYFACLAMAAEMSTGIPALAGIQAAGEGVSMLVVKLEGGFLKKAVDVTTFSCKQVQGIFDAIDQTIETGEGVEFRAESTGFNEAGEVVAVFYITWSFKRKRK